MPMAEDRRKWLSPLGEDQPFHPTSDSVRQAGQHQFTTTQGAVLIQAGVVGWILIRCHRDYFRTLPATWAYCCGDFWIGQEPSSSIVSQDWYKSASMFRIP